MQGKSCFNFSSVDEHIMGELEALTSRALASHEEVVASAMTERRARR